LTVHRPPDDGSAPADGCVITGWTEVELPSWPARRRPLTTWVPPRPDAGAFDPYDVTYGNWSDADGHDATGALLMGGGVALMAEDSEAAMTDLWALLDPDNFTSRLRLPAPLPLPLTISESSQHSLWRASPDDLLEPVNVAAAAAAAAATPTPSPSGTPSASVSPTPTATTLAAEARRLAAAA
jgi:hypothetical protein